MFHNYYYNKSRTGLAISTIHRNTAPLSDYYALLSHPLLTKDEPKRVPLPSLQDRKRVIVALIGRRPGISKIGVPGSVSHHPISPYSHTKWSTQNIGNIQSLFTYCQKCGHRRLREKARTCWTPTSDDDPRRTPLPPSSVRMLLLASSLSLSLDGSVTLNFHMFNTVYRSTRSSFRIF